MQHCMQLDGFAWWHLCEGGVSGIAVLPHTPWPVIVWEDASVGWVEGRQWWVCAVSGGHWVVSKAPANGFGRVTRSISTCQQQGAGNRPADTGTRQTRQTGTRQITQASRQGHWHCILVRHL